MKFCSYSYWLIEKFTQESDPIGDLGIGIVSSLEAQEEFFMSTLKEIKKRTKKSLQIENADQNAARYYYNIPCFSFRQNYDNYGNIGNIVLVVSKEVLKRVKDFWINTHTYLYNLKYPGEPCWVIIESDDFKIFKLVETDEMIKYVLKKLNE